MVSWLFYIFCCIHMSHVYKYKISSAKDGDSATVKKALEFGIDPDAKERDEVIYY